MHSVVGLEIFEWNRGIFLFAFWHLISVFLDRKSQQNFLESIDAPREQPKIVLFQILRTISPILQNGLTDRNQLLTLRLKPNEKKNNVSMSPSIKNFKIFPQNISASQKIRIDATSKKKLSRKSIYIYRQNPCSGKFISRLISRVKMCRRSSRLCMHFPMLMAPNRTG